MLVDTNTVTPEQFYIQPMATYEIHGLPPTFTEYAYISENVNEIRITKPSYITTSKTSTTTNINEYEIEYTNYKYAKKLIFKSDMTKRKEFKLIFSDLFDMLSNQDIVLYNSLLAHINVNSSSMYVLQSLLRLSYTYKKELPNWEKLLTETKNKYMHDERYDVDMELNGLFA